MTRFTGNAWGQWKKKFRIMLVPEKKKKKQAFAQSSVITEKILRMKSQSLEE